MNDLAVVEAIKRTGAFIDDGHFVYTATPKRHGQLYVNWAEALADPQVSLLVSQKLAELVYPLSFTTIVGPTHTGDKVASDLNRQLFLMGRKTNFAFAQETGDGGFFFPRGLEKYVEGQEVLLVDDVLNNMSTTKKLLPVLNAVGAKPVSLVAGCNRSDHHDAYEGIPIISLIRVIVEQWLEEDCLLCRQEVTPNKIIGHGRQFLEEFGSDPSNWPANKKVA